LYSPNIFTLVSNQTGCHGSLRVSRRLFLKSSCQKSCITNCLRRKLRDKSKEREYVNVFLPLQSVLIVGMEEKYLYVIVSEIFFSRNILEKIFPWEKNCFFVLVINL